MNLVRKNHSEKVIVRAKLEIQNKQFELAWRHLEEAHIFSQPFPFLHTYVHWEMLVLALLERNYREIRGQILRFLLAAPSSIFGRYPTGNTGRSNIGLFTTMALSRKVALKLRELDKLEQRRLKNGGILEKRQRQHPLTRT